jgi:hypothetical protein
MSFASKPSFRIDSTIIGPESGIPVLNRMLLSYTTTPADASRAMFRKMVLALRCATGLRGQRRRQDRSRCAATLRMGVIGLSLAAIAAKTPATRD